MNLKTTSVACALVWALGLATIARGAALQPKHVPADAKWLVHVDFEAAKKSAVVAAFYQACVKPLHESMGDADSIRNDWGVGLVHHITLYGSEVGKHHAVMVVQANIGEDKLLKKLESKGSLKKTEHGNFTIHSWSMGKRKRAADLVLSVFKPGVMVVARDEKLVATALDVLEGKSPALADNSPLAAKTPPGTITVARAVGIEELAGECPVVKQLRSLDYVASEQDGQWTEHLTLNADSPETAARFRDVLQGVGALASLFLHDHAAAVELINKAKLEVTGNTVHLAFSAPDSEIVAQLPVLSEALKHHLQRHLKMHHHRDEDQDREGGKRLERKSEREEKRERREDR